MNVNDELKKKVVEKYPLNGFVRMGVKVAKKGK